MDLSPSQSFLSWIAEHGGSTQGIEIREAESNRGVFAINHINKDDVVSVIPTKLFLFNNEQREKDILNQIGPLERPYDYNYLPITIRLIEESKNQDSFWSPYINYLPHLPHHHYGPSELNLLKNTAAWLLMTKYQADTDMEYNHLYKLNNNAFDISKDSFVWAKSMFFSRAFSGDDFGWTKTGCFIPFIDMINHSVQPNVSFSFNKDTNEFVCTAAQDITPGTELAYSHGELSNAELLTFYGFTTNNNRIISVVLPVDKNFRPGSEDDSTSEEVDADKIFRESLTTSFNKVSIEMNNYLLDKTSRDDFSKVVNSEQSKIEALLELIKLRVQSLSAKNTPPISTEEEPTERQERASVISDVATIINDEQLVLAELQCLFTLLLSDVGAKEKSEFVRELNAAISNQFIPKIAIESSDLMN